MAKWDLSDLDRSAEAHNADMAALADMLRASKQRNDALEAKLREYALSELAALGQAEEAQARAEAAEAQVAALTAQLATARQLVTHAATELAQSAQDMSAMRAERALHKAIRALADDPETIARIVAQVKEGRG